MKEIDCRGLSCPAPVLQTKAALQEAPLTKLRVLVDNPASLENVKRFLTSQGFETSTESAGEDHVVIGWGNGRPKPAPAADGPNRQPGAEKQKIMVMATTDRLGSGDDELGRKLMVNFIKTLDEMGDELWRLVFVNNGVKLACETSAVLDDLKAYRENGLQILVCGTCLDHFNLLEQKRVGETTNMLDIVTAMQLADKVINL